MADLRMRLLTEPGNLCSRIVERGKRARYDIAGQPFGKAGHAQVGDSELHWGITTRFCAGLPWPTSRWDHQGPAVVPALRRLTGP